MEDKTMQKASGLRMAKKLCKIDKILGKHKFAVLLFALLLLGSYIWIYGAATDNSYLFSLGMILTLVPLVIILVGVVIVFIIFRYIK